MTSTRVNGKAATLLHAKHPEAAPSFLLTSFDGLWLNEWFRLFNLHKSSSFQTKLNSVKRMTPIKFVGFLYLQTNNQNRTLNNAFAEKEI